MVWLVDDVAEAALGPWGLLIGAGVGVGILARRRVAPAASAALATGRETTARAGEWANGQPALDRARVAVGGAAGTVAGLGVVERARTALAEVGDWWSDLYAEARSEWEADRSASARSEGPDVKGATRRLERASRRRRANTNAARDASGRFVKRGESASDEA